MHLFKFWNIHSSFVSHFFLMERTNTNRDHNVLLIRNFFRSGNHWECWRKISFSKFRYNLLSLWCFSLFRFTWSIELSFSFERISLLTTEEVKAIASKSQRLQRLVINHHHCPNVKPNDLKDFKPTSKLECDWKCVWGEDSDLTYCIFLSLSLL